MTQQIATEFAGAMLDMQLGDTIAEIEALKTPEYAEAATEWQKQAEDLSITDQQALSRTLRRGRRLLRQMRTAAVESAPLAAAPPLSLAAAAAAAAAKRLKRRKCALLPGDAEQLTLLGKFLLRQPDVAALVKKGFNPVDAALMNPAQRQEALKAPVPECFSATARTNLDQNPFSYRLADDCYPMDQGTGEFPDLAACRKAQAINAAQDAINKFLDVAYGTGMTSEKMQFLQWMMDEEPDPVTLWNELRDTGVQQAKKDTTVYDQVLPEEAQASIVALREQMKRVDPVTRRTLETRIEAIQEQQVEFRPRQVRVPDPRAQRNMARQFFEQKLTGEEALTDPMGALLAENQKLREAIENLRAGQISETEMEASQQRFLHGEVTAAHAPALQELNKRVSALETAERVDAAQVQGLQKQLQGLFQEYSADTSELGRRLRVDGTDKTYHDYIAQQVRQQIEAQEPSVGMQAQRVVQSVAFRRAMKRFK